MKRLIALAWLLSSAGVLCRAQQSAPDILQADAQHSKLIYEDAQVRVVRTELPPGETSAMHAQAESMVSIVNDSRLRVSSPGAAPREISYAAGTTQHRPASVIEFTNVGNEIYVEISTEIKKAAATPSAATTPPAQSASAPGREAEHPAAAATAGQSQPAVPSQPTQPAAPQAAPPTVPPAPPARGMTAPGETSAEGLKRVQVNGVELEYMEAGSGPPLVLVHDMLQDFREWKPLIDQLAMRFHVVAYSRRDHYPNRIASDDYSFRQQAHDLAGLASALQAGPVNVMADRDGATVALMAAAEQPAAFRTMVVIEPVLEQFLPPETLFGVRGARQEIYRLVHKTMSKKNTEDGLRLYYDWVRGNESWASLPRERADEFRDNATALKLETAELASPEFTCAEAKKIASPVLVVNGPATSPNAAAESAKLTECLAAAEKTSLPIGSRFAPLPADGQTIIAVSEFLLRQH